MDSAKSGAWQVIKNIICELKEIDKNNKYVIFVEKNYKNDFGDLPVNFSIIRTQVTAKQPIKNILWHSFILPFLLVKYKVDVIHLPWHSASLLIKTRPTILTVLDLTEFRLKCHYDWLRIFYRKIMLPISSKLADKIVAISQFTKKDITDFLNIPDSKIDVIYCAPQKRYKVLDKNICKEFVAKYSIKCPYILYVGQVQHPNKNLPVLLQAFSIVKKTINVKYQLILVGKRHHTGDIVYKMAGQLGMGDDIRFIGYVPDEELPYFYNAADAFVYPSLFEGFGLPVIEAMSCGCPVVTSNRAALAEVAGNAAILINPESAGGIAEAVMNLISREDKRREIIEKGLERAKNFSWAQSARDYLIVYENTGRKIG